MAEHLVSGLVRKREELAGLALAKEAEAGALKRQVATLDAAIRIFDPAYKAANTVARVPQKRLAPPFPFRLSRELRDLLREAGEPVETRDLTTRLLARHGMATEDKALFDVYATRVNTSLHHLARQKIAAMQDAGGGRRSWRLSNAGLSEGNHLLPAA